MDSTVPGAVTAVTAVTKAPITNSLQDKDNSMYIARNAGETYRIGTSDIFGCRHCNVKYDRHFMLDHVCSGYKVVKDDINN